MKPLIAQLVRGEPLGYEQAVEAFELIMTGQATGAQVGALLAMIQQRGATVDEIAAAAHVMRDKVSRVTVPDGLTVIDTCGTGGDHAHTFNVSTAAAIVAAAVGQPKGVAVAKHGNKAVTSNSGSSQVLETLGVRLQVTGETLTNCLAEAGICFCFAPAHHPAMKHAAPIRQELGIRTLFNVLGPLTNPAGAKRQVMGVFDANLTEPIAGVLLRLGAERAMVVHGQTPAGGLDELSIFGPTRVSEIVSGAVNTYELDPSTLGLSGDLNQVKAADPAASSAVIHEVLAGKPGPARDLVSLNAGAALVVAGLADDLAAGLELARAALDDGSAAATLQKLAELTQAEPTE